MLRESHGRGTWHATVDRVTKNQTWRKQLSTQHSFFYIIWSSCFSSIILFLTCKKYYTMMKCLPCKLRRNYLPSHVVDNICKTNQRDNHEFSKYWMAHCILTTVWAVNTMIKNQTWISTRNLYISEFHRGSWLPEPGCLPVTEQQPHWKTLRQTLLSFKNITWWSLFVKIATSFRTPQNTE